MKSLFANFSPGSKSRRDCMLKLGKFSKKSEFGLLSPERIVKRSPLVDLWKESSEKRQSEQVQVEVFLIEHLIWNELAHSEQFL